MSYPTVRHARGLKRRGPTLDHGNPAGDRHSFFDGELARAANFEGTMPMQVHLAIVGAIIAVIVIAAWTFYRPQDWKACGVAGTDHRQTCPSNSPSQKSKVRDNG